MMSMKATIQLLKSVINNENLNVVYQSAIINACTVDNISLTLMQYNTNNIKTYASYALTSSGLALV